MTKQKHHYAFVHNAFGQFIESTRDYFVSEFFGRFKWSVIGTFDKAVEYINKQDKGKGPPFDPPGQGPPSQQPELPALIINPMGEMGIDEARHGSKQLYRFPNLAPGMLAYLYEPIYKDANVMITPGFTRLRGELECIALLNSFYEYFDFRILLLQMFGGLERPIHPVFFDTFIILDNQLLSYKYQNDVLNLEYELDWQNHGAYEKLIKTTNKNEVVFPCRIRPFYTLTSQSDQSERYGGADKLAEYKLGFTISYEIEIPTMLMIFENLDLSESDRHLSINISYGSSSSEYYLKDEYYKSKLENDVNSINTKIIFPNLRNTLINKTQEEYSQLAGFSYDEEGNVIKDVKYTPINESIYESTINKDGEVEKVMNYELSVLSRYFHKLTKEQLEKDYVDIPLPIKIDDINYVIIGGFKVNSKFGEFEYKKHFDIITNENNNDTLRLFMNEIYNLNENDLIEIFYYHMTEVEK